jgi:hypothetical protein
VKDIPKEITAAPPWLDDIHEEVRTDLDFWMMQIRLEQGRIDEARPYFANIKGFFEKYSKGSYLIAKESFERHLAKNEAPSGSASKSGCFIATAACGDLCAPEVVALSAFRDEILLGSRIGRGFVRLYYALSPPFAAVISRSRILRGAALAVVVRPTVRLVQTFRRRRFKDHSIGRNE